jgi:phosphoribosyl 1,2-cyclic phosphodiesterase
MKGVRFWGTRGSLPVSLTAPQLRDKLRGVLRAARGAALDDDAAIEAFLDAQPFALAGTYGGHSACVQIDAGSDDFFVCDMGSGLRPFGQWALKQRKAPLTFHVFMSHLHWDHIMGAPFFVPAFIPGNRVVVYGSHPGIEAALRRQNEPPSFPVGFDVVFGARIEFVHLQPGVPHRVGPLQATTMLQRHAGDSYGWRFEAGGKTLVYSTDSEHPLEDPAHTERFVQFFSGADLVIFDAMYSLADTQSVKADWGHSSNIVGVELCQRAGVRHLCMTHHEPVFDDTAIEAMLAETRRLEEITRGEAAPLRISAACDGLEIAL